MSWLVQVAACSCKTLSIQPARRGGGGHAFSQAMPVQHVAFPTCSMVHCVWVLMQSGMDVLELSHYGPSFF